MEKKEPIKVSMSTFFLIFAIIVIAVMGYFIFRAYNEKALAEEKSNELNAKVNSLENVISNVQNTISTTTETNVKESSKSNIAQQENQKLYSYKDVKGVYKYTTQDQLNGENFDIECILYLYEDGTFNYSHEGVIGQAILGNYILDNDTIILNKLFRHGNDLSLGTAKGQLRLKLNSDETITDSNNSFGIEKTKNITLAKISKSEEEKYISSDDYALIGRINACIKEGTIYNGEAKN